jgi:hypothetical protein
MDALYRRPGPWPATAIPRDINGRKLFRRLKQGLNPRHCALLALELEQGTAILHHLTPRQAQKVTRANQRDVAALRRATAEESAQVKLGLLSLAELRNRTARAPTDATVDRTITKLGADRVLQALDRITQPTLVAAE